MSIIDTNNNTFNRLGAFKRAGVTIFGRYISRGDTGEEKVIKPGEAKAIADAGCQLFLIYESTAMESLNGAVAGKLDGEFALSWARRVGAPQGAAIYATVDFDASTHQIASIVDYFAAFKDALQGYYTLGAYSSGYVCGVLYTHGLIKWRWLTMSSGFQGSRQALDTGAYELRQAVDKTIAGVDVDPDSVNVHLANGYFGQFTPFASSDAETVDLDAQPVSGVVVPMMAPNDTASTWTIPGMSWIKSLF